MSTTTVALRCAAASARAARSPSALVISISPGAATTGTPLNIATGDSLAGIRARPGRVRGLAPEDEQGDIVAGGLAADQGAHDRGAHILGRLRGHRLAEPVQAVIDRLVGALDEPVGVEAEHGS